jgi:phage gp29-like protein
MPDINEILAPPPNDPNPPLPEKDSLVTPEILYLNQASTFRLASAFAGVANPTVVWQQMIDNNPQAILYYRELEEKDEDVGDAIAEMKLSVQKREMQITPGDESARAVDAANFIEQQINALPDWRNSFDALLDAPFYGHSISEMIFDVSEGQAALTDVCDRPQELFCFAPLNYPQIGQLRLKNFIGDYDGVKVPEAKFITFASRSRAGNRMGRPLLRSVYWASWFKRNVQRFWMRLAERGPGTAVVTYPQGGDADEKRQALAAAEALIENVAMAVPESFQVLQDLLKGTRTADPATYEQLYSAMESKIYRRIVGSTLTSHGSDGGKGTQALGNVHAETKEDRSVELTLQIDAVLNRQLVRPLVLWNFGPDCPMPKLAHDTSNAEDLGARVTVDDTLQSMGLPMTKKYVYNRYGVDVPEEGDELLERPAAPAPSITTPAGAPDRPQFSDERAAQVKQEIAAFDSLFDQLKNEARADYRERITQIAQGAERANVRPGS